MKSRIAAAAAVILMLLSLASCGLPKITGDFDFGKKDTTAEPSSLTRESESEAETEKTAQTEKTAKSESVRPGVTETDASPAKTTAGGISEIIETATTALRTTSENNDNKSEHDQGEHDRQAVNNQGEHDCQAVNNFRRFRRLYRQGRDRKQDLYERSQIRR